MRYSSKRKQSVNEILAGLSAIQRPPAQVKHAMAMAENIMTRCSGRLKLDHGEDVWVNVDVGMSHNVCGPGTMGIFKREFGENVKMEGGMALCNMVIEEDGKNGVVPADEFQVNYLEDKTSVEYEPLDSDKDIRFIQDYRFDVSKLELSASKRKKVKVPTYLVQITHEAWMDIDIASKSQDMVERLIPRYLRKLVVILQPVLVVLIAWVALETLPLSIVNLRYVSLSQTGISLAVWATKKHRSTRLHLT